MSGSHRETECRFQLACIRGTLSHSLILHCSRNLLQATADLKNSEANLAAAQANLEKAKSALSVQTKADYDRAVGLTKDGVMSKQQQMANRTVRRQRIPVDATPNNIHLNRARKSALKRLLSRSPKPISTTP